MASSTSDDSGSANEINRFNLIVQKIKKILRFIDKPIALNIQYSNNRAGELKQNCEFYSEPGVLVYENHVAKLDRIINEVLGISPLYKKSVNERDIFLLRSGEFLECLTEETIFQDSRGNQMLPLYHMTRSGLTLVGVDQIITHYGQEFESEFIWHLKTAITWEIFNHPSKQIIISPVLKFLSDMRLTAAAAITDLIEKMMATVHTSDNVDWRSSTVIFKQTIIERLQHVKDLAIDGQFILAYNKLLRIIKPRLTGLKTDADEKKWGTGILDEPWVEAPALQKEFQDRINSLLRQLILQ